VERLRACDGPTFREFYDIYVSSIADREQKPETWICEMVRAPEYHVWVMKDGGHVRGFSILFLPPGETFALLEYMAVAPERRNHGLGGELFRQSMDRVGTAAGRSVPVVLEIDSDREACGDEPVRRRRKQFYRRLGCLQLAGLHYLLPLSGHGPVPEMDLMVYSADPLRQLPKVELERWLRTIYRDVYHCPADDPRIARMLHDVPDPVSLE
jgi:GNAT superfamily N-acetyltransferase